MTSSTLVEKLVTTYYRYLIGVVVVLVVAAGYFLFLQNKITTIQSITTGEQARAEQQLKQQQALSSSLQASLNNYKKIFTDDQVKKLDAVLPSDASFPPVLLAVKSIAAAANLDLDTLSVAIVTPTKVDAAAVPVAATDTTASASSTLNDELASVPHLMAQDVSISVSGGTSYASFKRFLSLLENSQRLFDVLTLNYSTPADNSSGVTYSLTLRTYSYQAETSNS